MIAGYFGIDDSMLYFRVVTSQLQVVIFVIIFYLLFMMTASIMRWKTNSAVIFCALNYIFISNQPGIFTLLTGSFSCTSASGESFVKDYVQYLCDTRHSYWKYLFMLPMILLWALFIPMI